MFYNWTSQRSALSASLQLDLKSDHRTVCPPLGEKEPYVRRVRDQALAASCRPFSGGHEKVGVFGGKEGR